MSFTEMTESISSKIDSFIVSLFPQVTTHLKHPTDYEYLPSKIFPHDCLLAAVSIAFNRYTVKYPNESRASRIFWSALLCFLTVKNFDYWILISAHLLSFVQYAFQSLSSKIDKGKKESTLISVITESMQLTTVVTSAYLFIVYVVYSVAHPNDINSLFNTKLYGLMVRSSIASSPHFASAYGKICETVGYLLPIAEFKDAYNLLIEFVDPAILSTTMGHLLFITFHIQTGMGYLGIEFLRNEQARKNALIKIEDEVKKNNKTSKKSKGKKNKGGSGDNKNGKIEEEKDASENFRKSAGPFIFFVALPYMAQIVFYGAINMYAFHCFRDDFHRTIRLNGLFDNDGSNFVSTASAKSSSLSPGVYATNAETITSTVYDLINQNLFSLPKLMLLPQIVAKQPMLLIKITPLILLTDYIKSTVVSAVTTEVERINKGIKDMESTRNRIEQYDLKNADLIQRSGYDAISFTEKRWVNLTESIQDAHAQASIMRRSKMYFSWLQRHFVMMALVDCALAKLIAVGKIVAADIFVYARAIEDLINFVLMRSRAESELASMASSVKILKELKNTWDESADRNLLECTHDPSNGIGDELAIQGVSYTRGSASVQIEDITLSNGVYAVTGANGSGKSTLFRVLMACDTNRKSIDLDDSIKMSSWGTLKMPSQDVVEISQNFYWPLMTIPVDWIYHTDLSKINANKRTEMVEKVQDELRSLKFYPETNGDESSLESDITMVRDDWFADLSGGQKSKVELVRKVFLTGQCPKVLLIDETFAPLDPDSKSLVMQKLKEFCKNSIVLVIYHADVQAAEGDEAEQDDTCVPSSNFFDSNIHVEDGLLSLRPVCVNV